jgi:hypothetical protein
MLLSEICSLVSVRRPLWQEDGSAICIVITQWSESLRTRNHTFLSHLRLPQPGGPGSRIYIPQEQGGPVKPPGTGIPLHRPLRFAGIRRRYFNCPSTWKARSPYIYPSGTWWSSPKSKSRYDRRPVNQYVLVPSPLGIKGVPSEWILIQHQDWYIKETFFYITIGRAACEACSATWSMSTNLAFVLGPRKTTENLDLVGRSQDLLDANWLIASSPALNTRVLTLVPICVFFSFENI